MFNSGPVGPALAATPHQWQTGGRAAPRGCGAAGERLRLGGGAGLCAGLCAGRCGAVCGAAPSGRSAAIDGAQPTRSSLTPGQPRSSREHLPAGVTPPGRRSVGAAYEDAGWDV